ncbi:hypothetical protein RRG08_057857, partial [Elysia crispata]
MARGSISLQPRNLDVLQIFVRKASHPQPCLQHDSPHTYTQCQALIDITNKSFNRFAPKILVILLVAAMFFKVPPAEAEIVLPVISDLYPGSGSEGPFDLQLPIQVTMAVIEPNNQEFSFALPKVLPVMDYAVAKMNEKYRGRIEFRYAWGLGSCDRDVVGVEAARLSCSNNITAFIGPACSKSVEIIGFMANTWNIPIITPIGNTENIGDKTIYPRLTRINPWMQSALVTTVFTLLDMNHWKNVAFFYDDDVMLGDLLGETFTKSFKATARFLWHSYVLFSKKDTRMVYRKHLEDAALRARVFIICAELDTRLDVLLEAHDLGFTTNGEFVFIVIGVFSRPFTDENTWNPQPAGRYPPPEVLKEAIGHCLFLHIDGSGSENPEWFEEEIIQRSEAYGIYYDNTSTPSSSLSRYYDAVCMYATAVNDTLAEGGNPYDGLAVTSKIWNRTFYGMLSGKITINSVGDRFSDVIVSVLDPQRETIQTYAVYESVSSTLTFKVATKFPWPYNKGEPPPDQPLCGFAKKKCSLSDSDDSNVVAGVSGFFGVVVMIGGVVAVVMFRRWKAQSERDMWWWKIDSGDLSISAVKHAPSILSMSSK